MKISYTNQLTLVNTSATYEAECTRLENLSTEEKAKFRKDWKTDLITEVVMEDVLEFGVAKATFRQTGLTRSSMVPKYNVGEVLAYVNTVKALISIVDPDRQVITIDNRDYYYADYSVPQFSASELLISSSGRIATSPKMMKRNKWCVDRIIKNYDEKYLVSPAVFEEIQDTLFNGGVDQVLRTTSVTPEKEAAKYLSSQEYLLPEDDDTARFDDVIEIAVDGTLEGRVMTQVLGVILDPNHNLCNGDVGTTVSAEVKDEVFKYFRQYRKKKQPISKNIDNSGSKPKHEQEADSLSVGQDAKIV